MTDLLTALMVWAAAFTGLPVPDRPPEIRRTDACTLQMQMFPGEPCSTKQVGNIVARYYHKSRTIMLLDTWRPDTMENVSTLLHEVVHYVQDRAGKNRETVYCVGRDIEWPAYKAEHAFVMAAGYTREEARDLLGLNATVLLFATQCPPRR